MKERPILFSAPMVRAILSGAKTQTRRVIKTQPSTNADGYLVDEALDMTGARRGLAVWFIQGDVPDRNGNGALCPYGQPADRLWVREGYSGDRQCVGVPPRDWVPGSPIWYWADGNPSARDWTRPKPGMHMPRWASRITLEVTEVRVERLQDISGHDCIAEGAPGGHGAIPGYGYSATPLEHYRYVWESINGAGSWDANAWVWCVSFRRLP